MARQPRRPFLDRPIARVIALVVFLVCIGGLLYFERGRFLGPEVAADDPFARCFAERRADIDQMLAEGVIDEERAELFLGRAEAMCRAEAGGDAPGLPPLPGQ